MLLESSFQAQSACMNPTSRKCPRHGTQGKSRQSPGHCHLGGDLLDPELEAAATVGAEPPLSRERGFLLPRRATHQAPEAARLPAAKVWAALLLAFWLPSPPLLRRLAGPCQEGGTGSSTAMAQSVGRQGQGQGQKAGGRWPRPQEGAPL